MRDLSLHILDIVENSIRAEAKLVEISVVEDMENDVLTLEIKDNGKGMDPETSRQASDPFFTDKPGRDFGMGLALLAQATREAEGSFDMSSTPTEGTRIRGTFRHSHLDRRPLGDICATLETMVVGHSGVDFVYEHRKDTEITRFDTRELGQR